MFQKKSSRFFSLKKEIERFLFKDSKQEISQILQVKLSHFSFCRKEIIVNRELMSFVVFVSLSVKQIFSFNVKNCHFVVVFVPSVIPNRGYLWNCYYFNNRRIISLLGYERLIELEGYLTNRRIKEFFYGVRADNLPNFIFKDRIFHPILIRDNYDIGQKVALLGKEPTEKILEKTGGIEKYLQAIFFDDNEINLEYLMEEVDRYENPAKEP